MNKTGRDLADCGTPRSDEEASQETPVRLGPGPEKDDPARLKPILTAGGSGISMMLDPLLVNISSGALRTLQYTGKKGRKAGIIDL